MLSEGFASKGIGNGTDCSNTRKQLYQDDAAAAHTSTPLAEVTDTTAALAQRLRSRLCEKQAASMSHFALEADSLTRMPAYQCWCQEGAMESKAEPGQSL